MMQLPHRTPIIKQVITGTISILILFIIIFAISLTYSLCKKTVTQTELTVATNNSIMQIANKLERNKAIWDKLSFYIYYKVKCRITSCKSIKAGHYIIPNNASHYDILKIITYGQIATYKFTVVEGKTSKEIMHDLQQSDEICYDISNDITEGSLLPDTYYHLKNDKASSLISKAQENQHKFLQRAWRDRDINVDRTIPNIQSAIILASILEKESADHADRKQIAGVLINRLKIGMALEADPTTIYGLTNGEHFKHLLSYQDLKIKSPYNTYMYPGLPKGPICHPSKSAIKAALHPTWSKYLYFIANSEGTHTFSATIAEHRRLQAQRKKAKMAVKKKQ